jgi:hypothetical protein
LGLVRAQPLRGGEVAREGAGLDLTAFLGVVR